MGAGFTLEEPKKLVSQLIGKFRPDADIEYIETINRAYLNLQKSRQEKLDRSRRLLEGTTHKIT